MNGLDDLRGTPDGAPNPAHSILTSLLSLDSPERHSAAY